MRLPSYVQIEPVGQCNLRCQMCPIQFRNDGPADGAPAFMSFETFTRIVDQFPDLEHLHLQGLGEPMMHPRFFDMVAYAAARGVRVTTNTNFTVLSPARAQRCITSGLDCMHVSVDAATPETYARIRERSRLERVARNMGFLQAAREEAGAARPVVRLVTVIMRQNLEELPALVRLAHAWGCASMFVQHLCHEFVERETLLNEEASRIEKYFSMALQVAGELGLELRLPRIEVRPHLPGTPGPERCDWPWRGAYISYQGYAMPCCMIATPDRMHFGNFSAEPADAIWNGAAYAGFRDRLASDEPPEICSSCSVYKGVF
jgi:radical SAM protein with 4Fe4S-binding SPASM domain